MAVQDWIDQYLIVKENKEDYYGHQYILDEYDHIIGKENRLLLTSINRNVYDVVKMIHDFGGIVVLAHVYHQKYGYLSFYHEFCSDLDFDGIEVTSYKEKQMLLEEYPQVKERLILMSSDAHQLEDINEAMYELDIEKWNQVWRKVCKISQ